MYVLIFYKVNLFGGGFDSFFFRVQFKRIILINNNLAAEQFIDTNIVKYSFITLHLALFKTKYPTKNPVVHCYMKIRQNAFFSLLKVCMQRPYSLSFSRVPLRNSGVIKTIKFWHIEDEIWQPVSEIVTCL